MKILVIGYGVVGQAVFSGLMSKHNMDAHDPPTNYDKRYEYDEYDGIILCLPTPAFGCGTCNDSLVRDYIKEIRLNSIPIPILLKSTTSIETIEEFAHDPCLTYNPEFLTEANSKNDFLNQEFAIFGGNQARFWYEAFTSASVKIQNVRFTDIVKAAYAKYAINCFLATKVVFFNELRIMYGDYNFDALTELISMDPRIGNSHMMVPGPDSHYGFGGMCFPKDTTALFQSSVTKDKPLMLLERVIDINDNLRNI